MAAAKRAGKTAEPGSWKSESISAAWIDGEHLQIGVCRWASKLHFGGADVLSVRIF